MKKNYLIIGASAAGISAALKLRQLDSQADIVCFSEEQEFPYNKCFLADYLHQTKKVSDIFIRPPDFLEQQNITLCLGTKIITIEADKKYIIDEQGNVYHYEKLLLAMGGSVVPPPIKGVEQSHVLYFYTFADADGLLNRVKEERVDSVVIIGAGLSGLECADALSRLVKKVTLVECASHILPVQATPEGAAVIEQALQEQGVELRVSRKVVAICKDSVEFDDGTILAAQKVVIACGARPNGWLAQKAGVRIESGAILTDELLKTSDNNIFAAGDVILVKDTITGQKVKSCSWPDALIQGAIAAENMAGGCKKYAGVTPVTSSAFFGIKFFSAGVIKNYSSQYSSKIEKTDNSYRLIVHDSGVIKGFLLVGQTHGLVDLKRSLLTQTKCLI